MYVDSQPFSTACASMMTCFARSGARRKIVAMLTSVSTFSAILYATRSISGTIRRSVL